MSDVTRDETRRACAAVGWEWYAGAPSHPGYFRDPSDLGSHLLAVGGRLSDADALALLEATGEPFEVFYFPDERDWSVGIGEYRTRESLVCPFDGDGLTLPAAAVRAVLAWKPYP